eukprot:2431499-Rhodomonas_salina.1
MAKQPREEPRDAQEFSRESSRCVCRRKLERKEKEEGMGRKRRIGIDTLRSGCGPLPRPSASALRSEPPDAVVAGQAHPGAARMQTNKIVMYPHGYLGRRASGIRMAVSVKSRCEWT